MSERRLEIAPSIWSPSTTAAESARFALDLGDARRRYGSLIDQAAELGNIELECWATCGLARTEVLAGNYETAAPLSETAFEFAEAMGRWQLPTRTLRAELDGMLGRPEDAEAGLRAVVADSERLGETRWLHQARGALGRLALARGDAATASDELRLARLLADAGQMRHAAVFVALVDEVEAAAAAGRTAQAEQAWAALADTENPPPWLRPLALRAEAALLASRDALPQAEEALARALDLQSRSFLPLQRGRTLLVLGSVRRRLQHRKDARDTLGQALAIFEELAARPWAEQAQGELERIGGRSAGEGLTPSEQRIAELVAEGKKNKEVAAALVIAERSVESALTQIYRKLDVRSRTELARKLARR